MAGTYQIIGLKGKGGRLGDAVVRYLVQALLPGALIVILVVLWQMADRLFGIPPYLLPPPSDFLPQFWNNADLLWHHTWATALVALSGFAIGAILAIPLALAIASYPTFGSGIYPLLNILQITPKTIVAPLLIVWLGIGYGPQIALTVVMTFFPILVDSVLGFRAMDPRLYYIATSTGASPLQTFRYFRWPAALPYIFSGLKIGMVSAVTGVVVVEYIASNRGLGYLTLWASSRFDMPVMFAAIFMTALLGLAFNLILASLEFVLMPWTWREVR